MIKRAPLIAAGVALLLIIIAYFLLLSPRQSEIAELTATFETAQAEELTLQDELATLEELSASGPEFQRRIDENDLLIPRQADTPGLIRTLASVADQTGVDFAVLSQGTPAPADTYSSISLGISVTGRLDQTARYLYELENLDRAVKVTSVGLTPSETGVASTLSADVYTSDLSSGPGGTPGSQGAVAAPEEPAA